MVHLAVCQYGVMIIPNASHIHSSPPPHAGLPPLTSFRIPQASWIGSEHTQLDAMGLTHGIQSRPELLSEQPSITSEM